MKLKTILPVFFCFLFLSACSSKEDTNNIVWGDINESATYIQETKPLPSLVERVDKLDIKEYFSIIPIQITEEAVSGELPDRSGAKHKIFRIQLNGIYFDINEIASRTAYDYFVNEGKFCFKVPVNDGMIEGTIAQIAAGNTFTVTDEAARNINNIKIEYRDIYENAQNQVSGEYGNFYTYSEYVNYLNDHETLKKDITIYDKEQILDFLLDIFNPEEYTAEDFISTDNCTMLEYSEWYEVTNSYYSAKNSDYAIVLSIRRNQEGVFAYMVKYPYQATIDKITGEDYFTPSLIVNFSQNTYQQLAESYEKQIGDK